MVPFLLIGLGLLLFSMNSGKSALDASVDAALAKIDPKFVRRAGSVMLLSGVPYRIVLQWTATPGGARDLDNPANQRAIVRELSSKGATDVQVQANGRGGGWVSYRHTVQGNIAISFGTNVYGAGKLYAVVREDGKAWA